MINECKNIIKNNVKYCYYSKTFFFFNFLGEFMRFRNTMNISKKNYFSAWGNNYLKKRK